MQQFLEQLKKQWKKGRPQGAADRRERLSLLGALALLVFRCRWIACRYDAVVPGL
jgi:hypothetical protein